MKSITYVGPFDAVEIEYPVQRWVTVEHGKSVDLPDDLAASFLEQPDNWKPTTKTKKDDD